MTRTRLRAPLSLLAAATTWGLIWYPYRLLEQAGVSGILSSLLTYGLALGLVLALYRGRISLRRDHAGLLLMVALAAGWTNLAYVLAVIQGEIMRVMLLFYLAPLWTIFFARFLLKEHLRLWGYLVIGLSLTGAYVMLAGQDALPAPANPAEWLALSAGIGFALSNVLSRRLRDVATETRAVWIFGGVVLITLVPLLWEPGCVDRTLSLDLDTWGLLIFTAALLILATLTVQFGLARLPANRASVIMLSELLVAALASWWLAGEVMGPQEWLGGAMIASASLLSAKLEHNDD